jgi:hypothetical protein
MNSFTNSVNTLQSRGLLTAAQAADLLQQAQEIKDDIGCQSITSSTSDPASAMSSKALMSLPLSLPG